jgi:hypothetical protein
MNERFLFTKKAKFHKKKGHLVIFRCLLVDQSFVWFLSFNPEGALLGGDEDTKLFYCEDGAGGKFLRMHERALSDEIAVSYAESDVHGHPFNTSSDGPGLDVTSEYLSSPERSVLPVVNALKPDSNSKRDTVDESVGVINETNLSARDNDKMDLTIGTANSNKDTAIAIISPSRPTCSSDSSHTHGIDKCV